MNTIKKLFAKPSAASLAQQEYEDAQRHLLQHQASHEYHANMVKYYEQSIKRLSNYIQKETETA